MLCYQRRGEMPGAIHLRAAAHGAVYAAQGHAVCGNPGGACGVLSQRGAGAVPRK